MVRNINYRQEARHVARLCTRCSSERSNDIARIPQCAIEASSVLDIGNSDRFLGCNMLSWGSISLTAAGGCSLEVHRRLTSYEITRTTHCQSAARCWFCSCNCVQQQSHQHHHLHYHRGSFFTRAAQRLTLREYAPALNNLWQDCRSPFPLYS